MSNDIDNQALYINVKNKIKEDTSDMPPNTRIPSRNELIKKYGATRTTIEKAISQLTGEGYLYSLDGSGTYISEKTGREETNKSMIKSWGVIIPNIIHDTYPETLRGIEDVANLHNINVIICNTDQDLNKFDNYVDKLIDTHVDGIIMVPIIPVLHYADSFRKLNDNNIPFVYCNRGIDGVEAPRVLSNNFYGAYIAAKHLVESGYKRIAFISRKFYTTVDQRYQGYLAAMYESNNAVTDEYVCFGEQNDHEKIGYTNCMAMLEYTDPPDAFLCFNDSIAHGVYKAVAETGLSVGKDIGIVGYDDTVICEMLPVKLTSVKYPKYETGKIAADILLGMISRKSISNNHTVVLKPELIIRESSIK
jgi:DNA-binding LacI/PurR family transcriptional regulator